MSKHEEQQYVYSFKENGWYIFLGVILSNVFVKSTFPLHVCAGRCQIITNQRGKVELA